MITRFSITCSGAKPLLCLASSEGRHQMLQHVYSSFAHSSKKEVPMRPASLTTLNDTRSYHFNWVPKIMGKSARDVIYERLMTRETAATDTSTRFDGMMATPNDIFGGSVHGIVNRTSSSFSRRYYCLSVTFEVGDTIQLMLRITST